MVPEQYHYSNSHSTTLPLTMLQGTKTNLAAYNSNNHSSYTIPSTVETTESAKNNKASLDAHHHGLGLLAHAAFSSFTEDRHHANTTINGNSDSRDIQTKDPQKSSTTEATRHNGQINQIVMIPIPVHTNNDDENDGGGDDDYETEDTTTDGGSNTNNSNPHSQTIQQHQQRTIHELDVDQSVLLQESQGKRGKRKRDTSGNSNESVGRFVRMSQLYSLAIS